MSVNDRDPTLSGFKGIETHAGVANPTSSSVNSNPLATNFVDDPTTEDTGAGAGPKFEGHNQAARTLKETAGVVEHFPGTIETTNIDPLNENSNKDDGFANVTQTSGSHSTGSGAGVGQQAYNAANSAATAATGAAKLAYGTAAGDEAAKQAGRDALYGN